MTTIITDNIPPVFQGGILIGQTNFVLDHCDLDTPKVNQSPKELLGQQD
jgi:hypothetical protein